MLALDATPSGVKRVKLEVHSNELSNELAVGNGNGRGGSGIFLCVIE